MSAPRSPSASPIRRPVSRRRSTRNWSRGRRQHASTASACSSVSASGNGACARALSARARTVRNWPDSPASNPGGVNRSHRGSDSCPATAMLDQPGPGAEPQELAHRGERGIDRGARTQPPAPARSDLDEMLETGQRRQADRGPLHPLPGAPAQEARHPPGIGTDRVRRTARPVQRPQEIAGLPVHDEPGIEHHPQLGTVKGRHRPLRPERQVSQIGHVTQRNRRVTQVPDIRKAPACHAAEPTSLTG